MMNEPDKRIWKSYVWHEDKCFFVSTIQRTYETWGGYSRGQETITWEYDYKNHKRGKLIHQAGHVCDHQAVCRCLINWGEIPNEDDERWERMGGKVF
jgi:hypothetical protein